MDSTTTSRSSVGETWMDSIHISSATKHRAHIFVTPIIVYIHRVVSVPSNANNMRSATNMARTRISIELNGYFQRLGNWTLRRGNIPIPIGIAFNQWMRIEQGKTFFSSANNRESLQLDFPRLQFSSFDWQNNNYTHC